MNNDSLQSVIATETYKLALDSTYNHVVITDPDGVIIYANKAVELTTGFTKDEIMGATPRLWGGLMTPDFYAKLWHSIKVEKKVFRGEITNKRKNGEHYIAKATISPILTSSGELLGFIGTEEDISQQKAFEKQLIDTKAAVEQQVIERTAQLSTQKARLSAAINSLQHAFLILDPSLVIVEMNSLATKILGIQPKEWSCEVIATALGREVGLMGLLAEVVVKKNTITLAEIQYGKKILKLFIAPVIGENQELYGLVMTIRDITDQVALERSRDEFFSIASHELRTPLTAIRGNASLLLEYYADVVKGPEVKEMVTDIHQASVRLIGIVNDFLDMSRLEQGRMQFSLVATNVVPIIANVIENLQASMLPTVQLRLEAPAEAFALVDSGKFEQIIFNIVGNGLKFTTAGEVVVRVAVKEVAENGVAEKTVLSIQVKDTGRGIALAQQGLLFRKFQQAGQYLATRDTVKGTGLGLYISRLLAEGMRGSLELVASQENQGSTFELIVPAATEKAPLTS